jgi:hypothetical protein
MKKGHGLKRALPRIERSELEALPTGALLARLKRLHWCEESRNRSDMSDEEVASLSGMILFKEEDAWRSASSDVKDVLAWREHRENKP